MIVVLKYIIRSLLVVIWIGIIYACLVMPSLFQVNSADTRSLRIYTWAHRIDENMIRKFEKKTGIKVYLNYYESSEELLTKLEMTPSMDCDIMLPSGYVIQSMINSGLIKKIDKKRCPFLKNLYSDFMGLYFDPHNDYSLPLYWDVFGIGYNAKLVDKYPVDLGLLFDRTQIVGNNIGMSEDGREAIFLAAQYLQIPLNEPFTPERLDQIQTLLHKQKAWVGSYSDSQQGYFLSSDTFAVVASDRETICRQMLNNDFIQFALIPEGSMLRIDSVVINAATQKDDMIYQFLDFLFSYEAMLYHAQKFCILPTAYKALNNLDEKYVGISNLHPGTEIFKKLVVFQLSLTQKELNDFWIRFKAS